MNAVVPWIFLFGGAILSFWGVLMLKRFYQGAHGAQSDRQGSQVLAYMLAFAFMFVGALFAVLGLFMVR